MIEGIESGDIYPDRLQNGEGFSDRSKENPSGRLEGPKIIEPGSGESGRIK